MYFFVEMERSAIDWKMGVFCRYPAEKYEFSWCVIWISHPWQSITAAFFFFFLTGCPKPMTNWDFFPYWPHKFYTQFFVLAAEQALKFILPTVL